MSKQPPRENERDTARRPMERAFRSFMGAVLREKRAVTAAPSMAACDVVQQRVLRLYETVNNETLRHLDAQKSRAYGDVQYLMIAAADEAFLQTEWSGRAAWAARPLEAQVWKSHDAGERVFRTLEDVFDQRTNISTEVLLVYLHVLSIGFRGRFASLDPAMPEAYRRRLIDHVAQLGDSFSRQPSTLCPDALRHTVGQKSRLRLASLWRGGLPLLVVVVAWLVLGGVLFQLRSATLSDLLERIEAVR